jgi:hypothetical protein
MVVGKPTAQVPLRPQPPPRGALYKAKLGVSKKEKERKGMGATPSDIHGRNLWARTAQAPTAQRPCPRKQRGQPAKSAP